MTKSTTSKKFLTIFFILSVLAGCFVFTSTSLVGETTVIAQAKTLSPKKIKNKLKKTAPTSVTVKKDSDSSYITVNNNKPYFKKKWLKAQTLEYYSPLDTLGRCGTTFACIGKETMPTEERGSIGAVRPSGWQTIKYDRSIIEDLYLYNRCHLIGYQLTGQNDNVKNLITGTRYMNVSGMEPFENMVAHAVQYKNVHVLYRVTPIFSGDNLVADGVLMEAMSCEDKGKSLSFNVFCPNIQPGITINYSNGDSTLIERQNNKPGTSVPGDKKPNNKNSSDKNSGVSDNDSTKNYEYILNTNSFKFHHYYCSSVDDMAEHNKLGSNQSRDEIISMGYSPCGICKP